MKPDITYIISTYNSGHYLERCLYDLTLQTLQNYEVIIMNCSDDSHPDTDIAESWQQRDSRIEHIRLDKRVPYGYCWAEMFRMARGRYVSNYNSDDLHKAEFGEIVVNVMDTVPKHIGFCYTGLEIVNENGQVLNRVIKPPFNFEDYTYNCLGGCQLVIRNDPAFRWQLNWDLMLERGFEHISAYDYWLILFLMSLGFHGLAIPQILTIYTQRPDSLEHQHYALGSTFESLASISEFFPQNFITGRLASEFPEFADFSNLPDKQSWIEKRKKKLNA